MQENEDKIKLLHTKLDILIKRQVSFSKEIEAIREELNSISTSSQSLSNVDPVELAPENIEVQISPAPNEFREIESERPANRSFPFNLKMPKLKSGIEKFIGENLINKIGILITVAGVAIGAKYSIDHNLISPLTRIILGYMSGAILLGFGMKLKKNYENYSAVLISGAMAIMYFITYFAFGFYGLIPQWIAFILMVIFTGFTVLAALQYNRQVIAYIGLVGAYAVPFLLSNNSGQVAILFSYMAILNIGILVIAFRKNWKPLYYLSFALTWLICLQWFIFEYNKSEHFGLGLTFIALFFMIFYITFLAYKLFQSIKLNVSDILLLLVNSFMFYGLGYAMLDEHTSGEQLLGLFTLVNAIVHFIVGAIIYKRDLAERNLFYLITGLVLVFISIAIPVQLDGNWVTLLWVGQAALLFWIGRTKSIYIFEKMSYCLMLLAFFSIVHDWSTFYTYHYPYDIKQRITPILNINFLSSMLFILAFAFITYLSRSDRYPIPANHRKWIFRTMSFLIPVLLLTTIYFTFKAEIDSYWDQRFYDSSISISNDDEGAMRQHFNYALRIFHDVWVINYSLLFFSIISIVNIFRLKHRQFGLINLVLNGLAILVFLVAGLYELSELREIYLDMPLAEYYSRGSFYIVIRYISIVLTAVLMYISYLYSRRNFMEFKFQWLVNLMLHLSILWILSSELINWMDIGKSAQSYKLGLSILWGIYSLLLIAIGIWKNKKYLRISAIALFGITLIKLFFYDISELNTIAKTVVFVSLGILLLIISFLYNKYKHLINDEREV